MVNVLMHLLVAGCALAVIRLVYPTLPRRADPKTVAQEMRESRLHYLALERETMAAWEEACQCPDHEAEERALADATHQRHLNRFGYGYLPLAVHPLYAQESLNPMLPRYSDPNMKYYDYVTMTNPYGFTHEVLEARYRTERVQ